MSDARQQDRTVAVSAAALWLTLAVIVYLCKRLSAKKQDMLKRRTPAEERQCDRVEDKDGEVEAHEVHGKLAATGQASKAFYKCVEKVS